MDRNREGRRVNMAASNGLSRRRHRTSSLRDSPEEDGPVELQETARLRDRGSVKKDRDRERDRDRDRDRLSRSKRRRAERLMHGNNRENGDDESTEESVNDEEEEDDDDGGGGVAERVGTSMRLLPPNPSSLSSSSMANHLHRKSFPPPSKIFKAVTTFQWRPTDEMIGVTVPRKARSVSIKRSHHDWVSSVGGVGGEQIHRQSSTSPARSSGPSVPAMLSSTTPVSPSSSNASQRKKMKPNGLKQRPPKSSSKSSSSAQDEIEIEIAEVLYGMKRQPQVPSKQEAIGNDSFKCDAREANSNKSSADTKSRVSSPISNSPPTALQSSLILQTNASSAQTHMSAVAPKRKRPRPVKYEDENPSAFAVRSGGPVTSTPKVEIDSSEQPAKAETSSHNFEKGFGSAAENGGISYDLMACRPASAPAELQSEASAKPDVNLISDSKPLAEESEIRDLGVTKDEPESLKESSPNLGFGVDRENLKATKANSTVSPIDGQREKYKIDLMAPPPLRSSPEREGEIDFVIVDAKTMVTDVETETKANGKDDVRTVKNSKGDVNAEVEESKAKVAAEVESLKRVSSKERNIDLQLDLEKSERQSGAASVSGNKPHQNGQKQQQLHNADKNPQSNSLPLPVSIASWPGGLPSIGYMPPLQGVVSMDGSSVSSAAMQPPHWLSSHPRPKRCATHCYIARNIHYHQQFSRMNPFWPAAPGSALSYGPKACNVGVVPSTELLGNIPGRGAAQDKGQGLAIFPSNTGKDKGSPAVNVVDGPQRKQILLQQPLPTGAPSNILHGPAFIFPLSQQQAATSASVRPGSVKSSSAATGLVASSSTSSTATATATATAAAAAASAMSFSYPTIPGNETQYLAILQNGAYPIPIPAHVGAPPAYRGPHAQAMPFFNGSFYSSQMLHQSSQLQQQQMPATQSQQGQHQQGHQNPSISIDSSSSQKHLQNQQQMPPSSGISGGNGNLLGFPGQKNQTSQSLQLQQRHQPQNQIVSHQARQLESEAGSEDSPSTGDSRASRANMSIYGQSFTMPFPPPNFALISPAAVSTASGANGNHIEKKQQPQQQGSKAGVESLPSPAFAMPFASMNGAATASGLDISSLAQNHALRQSLPESTRHGFNVTAAAQAPQQKKNHHPCEEGKTSGKGASNLNEERKAMAGKVPATVGQSIAFFRSDTTGNSVPGSTTVDSSARTINLGSASGRASHPITSAAVSTVDSSSAQQQLQYQRFQHQHMMMVQRHQQQEQAAAVAARSKTPATSNGSIYSDQVTSSSSINAKFPNMSVFPQSLVQSSSSPGQSPQWKNSVRGASQAPPTMASSTSSTLKNLPQQQGRSQQSQTHISFASNQKTSAVGQVQLPSVSSQSPSSPMVVSSPTTSISKSAGGSPRTTASTSTGNKGGQASALSAQPAKSSQSLSSHKSSPVSGRSVPSILGNPHISSSSAVTKSQQQQQQQLQKHAVQQAQMLFSSAYMQVQGQHVTGTTNATSASSGYYNQRHRNEQQHQLQSSSATSSSGMLSLCPPVTPNTTTSDPTKAIAAAAAAANNIKGGILTSQGLMHAPFAVTQSSAKPHQLVPTGFSYVHPVPTPVQVKPTEQKQPAGE